MMENNNGFSSPRTDAFPAGLRVLVVDDDPTWLKILEKMLRKCSYEVTVCGLARDALNKLRERKDGYDIVISDVNMPDMDGFKLLEHVGLEMDLPVIMMSVDGETSRVMKGVQHGACDYLLKPIRMKELRNIWQHVLRKRIHEVRDIESFEGIESIQMSRNGSECHSDDAAHLFFCGDDPTSTKKRKDHDENDISSSAKKARVVWSVDLHQKFVKAVNQIGYDKVGPKKILDLMNVPWLTRENVASHLQKYRLYLTRLQKENVQKTSIGNSAVSFNIQNSVNVNYGVPSNTFVVNSEGRSHESDQKGSSSARKRALTVDIPDTHIVKGSRTELGRPFGSLTPYTWDNGTKIQLKQEQKPLHLPLPVISSGFSPAVERPGEVRPFYEEFRNNGNSVNPCPARTNDHMKTHQVVDEAPATTSSSTNHQCAANSSCIPEFLQRRPNPGASSPYPIFDDDLQLFLFQGGLQNVDFPQYFDPGLISEDGMNLYDPVIDQGLFIS